jgi:trimethylamine:corrinoid methyltransferase-like protein
VLTNAEVLAGIALLQLFHPGAPTFYSSCNTVMELRRGGVTGGGPEDALLQAARVNHLLGREVAHGGREGRRNKGGCVR